MLEETFVHVNTPENTYLPLINGHMTIHVQ